MQGKAFDCIFRKRELQLLHKNIFSIDNFIVNDVMISFELFLCFPKYESYESQYL